ncbi:MAG: ATP-binding protein [Micrococcales bacterium]|nr:ATP-binding protein [Micrococcales bacterium]MCL2668981.1 ATP-binding protein [Micrococcales bacterium]
MERHALEDLLRWRARPRRKPLLLRGARQVGKTWLIEELGRSFSRVVYVNFDESAAAGEVFEQDLDVERIGRALALLDGGGPIDPATTLIALDEIQQAPRALTALKYFAERLPHAYVIGAGSLLGVAVHTGTSFPVGKVEFCDLHPLSFPEFCTAVGRGDLADAITSGDLAETVPLHTVYADLLRRYYVVGGMPEAVATYIDTDDMRQVRRVHDELLQSYESDFSKHAPPAEVPRLREVFTSLPSQLAKENRKFVYGLVRSGARARGYETAMGWLRDAGMTHQVRRITTPRLPLTAYEDPRAFKLFSLDVGLLAAAAKLDPRVVVDGDRVFTEFKGALTEQYVLQQMVATGLDPHYWSSETGTAEVDFVVAHAGTVVPVEAKAEVNTKAKSLRRYRDTYQPTLAVRTAMVRYGSEPGLVSLPLYAAAALGRVIEDAHD